MLKQINMKRVIANEKVKLVHTEKEYCAAFVCPKHPETNCLNPKPLDASEVVLDSK